MVRLPGSFLLSMSAPLEGRPEADIIRDIATMATNDYVAVNESVLYIRPTLVAELRYFSPSIKVGLVLNMTGVWDRPSMYFPTMTQLSVLANNNNLWLYRSNGQRVYVQGAGWPTFALVDFQKPEVIGFFQTRIRQLKAQHDVNFFFLDECHKNLDFMPQSNELGWIDSRDYDTTMRLLMRSCLLAGMPPVINGTMFGTATSPGRFLQNSETAMTTSLIDNMIDACWNQPVSSRLIVLQCNNPGIVGNDSFVFYSALASLYDACSQFSDYAFRTVTNPKWEVSLGAGRYDSNNQPLVEVDGSWRRRDFQHGRVSLNIETKQVIVT